MCGRGALLRWTLEGGGRGTGLPESLESEGGPRRQGLRKMNWAACRRAVHRSAGARSVGLSGQEKRCSVVCGAEPQSGQAGDGALPTLMEVGLQSAAVARSQLRERTAVWSRKQSLGRVYFEGRAQKDFVGGGGGRRAGSHLLSLCLKLGFGCTVTPRPQNSAKHWGWSSADVLTQDSADALGEPGS